MKNKSLAGSAKWVACGLLLLGSGASLFLVSPPALTASACRDIASVQESADLDSNTAMGGHVTQHVLGMDPPRGASQESKTLFKDRAKFEKAWKTYKKISNPKNCSGGNSALQTFELGYYIDALACRDADSDGNCTEWDTFAAEKVAVGFIKHTDGTWILNTAYPVPMH